MKILLVVAAFAAILCIFKLINNGEQMIKKKVWMSWSSGKDSAYCLDLLMKNQAFEVVGLFTSINQKYQRVAMHGVRRELLELQAQRLNLPLHVIELPDQCSNEIYQEIFAQFIKSIEAQGIDAVAFGDIFLQDVRSFRENQFKDSNIELLFPLWHIAPSDKLSDLIISSGVKAVLTCVDTKQIDKAFLGQTYNQELIEKFAKTVDPCGENGEFHSFVYDSPLFSSAIEISLGEIVDKNQFVFIDVK